jgi:hypothetical protein
MKNTLAKITTNRNDAIDFEWALKTNLRKAYKILIRHGGQFAFDILNTTDDDEKIKLARDYIKLMAESIRVDQDVKKQKLVRKKWEFDAARICLQHLAQLQAMMKDDALDEEARIAQARHILFGITLTPPTALVDMRKEANLPQQPSQ